MSSWTSKPRLDVRRNDDSDISKEDESFASTSTRSSLGDPLASSRRLGEDSTNSDSSDMEATRKKKKKEKSKLMRMMEDSSQFEDRRKRFDGSFAEEEGISRGWQQAFEGYTGETSEAARSAVEERKAQRVSDRSPASSPTGPTVASPRRTTSLNRGGARDIKVNSRLSQRSQRLLATYYESTEFVDSPSATDESAGGESDGHDDIHGDEVTQGSSLVDDTKEAMLRLNSKEGKEGGKEGLEHFDDEPKEDAPAKTGLSGMASMAASMMDGLSNKARFVTQRESTRADLANVSSQRRQRRRWQRFDEPGAVQMHGRAYGAPPRPPDAKATTVRGMSDSQDFSAEDQLLMEEGVKLTTDGPLVQAMAVDEDECAPRAFVENDIALAKSTPLAMKHVFQERSVRRRLVVLCVMIALLIMMVTAAVTHWGGEVYDDHTNTSNPDATPTPSPTYMNDALAEALVPFSGHDALSDPSSPQSRACGWLSSHDKSGLEPTDAGFIQRYVMAVTYFSMGGENWLAQDNWLDPDSHECEWSSSVHCARDHSDRPCVTGIDLSRTGLEGSIPPELGYLSDIESINLAKNDLDGPIPSELFNITSLTELVLTSNMLSSTIPSSISNAKFLDFLNLSGNFLAGPIPDEMWDLTHLRTLDLSSNEFTGTISDRLENLNVLQTFDLRQNMLGGRIPDAISFLPDLAFVRLDDNRLDGEFPAVTSAFVQLQEFTVSNNFLSGTIPSLPDGDMEGFPGMSDRDFRLQLLDIAHNNFEGLVPEFVGMIPSLREFYFAGNSFGGTYPSMPGMWRSLEVVSGGMNQLTGFPPSALPPTLIQYDFHANYLTGGIPPELTKMFPRLEYLSLANNPLGGSVPSSFNSVPHLVGLDLRECDLTGTIPDLSSVTSLASFDIRANAISGTVPTSLGLLTTLTSLKLSSNMLTGTICPEIGNLSNLGELLLEENELTGTLPETLTNLADLVEFRVGDNLLEGAVPERLCNIVEGLSVDHVGCDLLCDCCVDESFCGAS